MPPKPTTSSPSRTSPETYKQEREAELRLEAFGYSGVDERHKKADIAALMEHGAWAKNFKIACEIVDEGGMLVFLGGRGNGKTQMAVELIRRTIRGMQFKDAAYGSRGGRERVAWYLRAREIGMVLRQAYGVNRTESESDVIKKFVEPRLLVIDECQEKPVTEFGFSSLTLLLDKRYGAMRPTIMIANMNQAEFADVMGPSVVDRISEGGGLLPFTWPSFRRRR